MVWVGVGVMIVGGDLDAFMIVRVIVIPINYDCRLAFNEEMGCSLLICKDGIDYKNG